jgi:putative transferase (TIGR04331 family)
MPKIPRYLITTSDERTWKFDQPVIFLGEWCRLYDRKHIWQDVDGVVAAPYGLGQANKDSDHTEARALEEKLFPILCDALNKHHGTQHGLRFWKIVLGHWLRRYVDVIVNRVKTLELCLQTYQLSGTTAFSGDRYSLAPLNSEAANWAFNDNRWNNVLYVRILSLLGVKNFPLEVIAGDESEIFDWTITATEVPFKKRILRWGYRQVGRLAGFLVRENDAFIINSYLPKKVEIVLQLAYRQVPQLWTSQKLELTKKPDRAVRQSLSGQFAGQANDTLFRILCSLVFELLPVCYLEGFAELSESVQRLPWPKRPKFILTSNNFDTDELFKLWTALKVQSGIKYVIGQHGNNYGTYRYMYPSIEEITSDKFLTWGWTDNLPQHTPAYVLKTAGRKAKEYNPNGSLLLIEDLMYQRLDIWDRTQEFVAYFSYQAEFIEKLQYSPRQDLTVRLHPYYVYLSPFEVVKWYEFDPDLKIDAGRTEINKLISESRLVVHGYDSTGILETLSQNVPTLAFWQNDLHHLRDGAKPYYQILLNAGIIHLTAESAAAKVNEIWDDVEGWWAQGSVQKARILFCDRYARVSRNPVRDLKALLNN